MELRESTQHDTAAGLGKSLWKRPNETLSFLKL